MFKKYSEKQKGVVALILLSLVFACMGIFARYLSLEFTILQQTYLRIAGAFFLGLLVFYKDLHFEKIKKISSKEWLVLVVRSVSLYLLGVTLISAAFIEAKYSNASFIAALPITAILGFVLLKEKVTFEKILYIIVGFIGVVLIAVQDYSSLFTWGRGEVLALISSFFFAFSYISRKWHTDLLNNKELAVIIFFISSILLMITSFLFGEGLPHVSSFTNFMLFILVLSALFNVANLWLTNYGFQKVEAVLGSNLLTLEVLFAVIIGVSLFGEYPTIKELLGGILIVFSAYRMNKIK
jgi:drug/metabolite transporter (DMT)-like permease